LAEKPGCHRIHATISRAYFYAGCPIVASDDSFEFMEISMDADQLVLLEVLSWLSPLLLNVGFYF